MAKVKVDINPDSLAARLREARLAAGLTQGQLGERAGVNQGQIAKLENGDRKSTTVLVQLAHACGVTPEWLDTGKPPKYAAQGSVVERALNLLDEFERETYLINLRRQVQRLVEVGNDEEARQLLADLDRYTSAPPVNNTLTSMLTKQVKHAKKIDDDLRHKPNKNTDSPDHDQ